MNPFKTIFVLLVIIICVYLGYHYKKYGNFNNITQVFSDINSKINLTKINTQEQSYSLNNSIDGQVTIEEQDGYTTIFTTLNDKHKKTYKEFKQNLESSSWSEKSYWGGTMRENGCGITSLAVIASRIWT